MNLLTGLVDWFEGHAAFTGLMLVGSVVLLVGSLWIAHYFLTTVPADYFSPGRQRLDRWRNSHPALRLTLLILKNALGILLIVLGLIMFVTPGQGVLTLLLGIVLTDFPGKRALERMILRRPTVLRLVNRMRARAGQGPLEFE